MRLLLTAGLILHVTTALATGVPNLVCREDRVLFVDPRTLSSQPYDGSTLLRVRDGSLYLAPTDRPEYLYGRLVETEPSRFSSGHKILMFDDRDAYRQATVVHAYRDEVRVSRVSCQRS